MILFLFHGIGACLYHDCTARPVLVPFSSNMSLFSFLEIVNLQASCNDRISVGKLLNIYCNLNSKLNVNNEAFETAKNLKMVFTSPFLFHYGMFVKSVDRLIIIWR
jgi:hypothetical protein